MGCCTRERKCCVFMGEQGEAGLTALERAVNEILTQGWEVDGVSRISSSNAIIFFSRDMPDASDSGVLELGD